MHFKKAFEIFFLISSLAVLSNADLLPVLSYLNTNQHSTNNKVVIGEAYNFDIISNKFKTARDLSVILVDQLNDQDLTQLLRKSQLKNVDFLPLVNSPSDSLNDFIEKNPQINVKVTYLNDLNDAFVKFSEKVANSKSVILTGRNLPGSNDQPRSKRDVDTALSNENGTSVFGSQCAASFKSVYFIDNTNPTSVKVNLDLNDNSTFKCDDSNGMAVLTFGFNPTNNGINGDTIVQVSLSFTANTQYWTFANGSVKTASNKNYGIAYLEAPYYMETPNSYSFVCTRTHYRLYNLESVGKSFLKVDFYIEYLQVQPFQINATSTSDYSFGRINYCQGFFSSGIWMAITSSLLLTSILAFGITMLMNIKTMDRFDDPKGKPLTIAMEK